MFYGVQVNRTWEITQANIMTRSIKNRSVRTSSQEELATDPPTSFGTEFSARVCWEYPRWVLTGMFHACDTP